MFVTVVILSHKRTVICPTQLPRISQRHLVGDIGIDTPTLPGVVVVWQMWQLPTGLQYGSSHPSRPEQNGWHFADIILKFILVKESCYILISNFKIVPKDLIENNCGPSDMVAKIWVNIGWDNSLLPDGAKLLPKPKLTYHQWILVAFTWGLFHRKCSKHHLYIFWKLLILDFGCISIGQWVDYGSGNCLVPYRQCGRGSLALTRPQWTMTLLGHHL